MVRAKAHPRDRVWPDVPLSLFPSANIKPDVISNGRKDRQRSFAVPKELSWRTSRPRWATRTRGYPRGGALQRVSICIDVASHTSHFHLIYEFPILCPPYTETTPISTVSNSFPPRSLSSLRLSFRHSFRSFFETASFNFIVFLFNFFCDLRIFFYNIMS